MKKKLILLPICLFAIFTSCSNHDDSNETKEVLQAINFSFFEEDFGTDKELSRSVGTVKPKTVDLGDCEAEVSVEREVATPATRKGPSLPTTGHYTIRAYQSGVLKGEISGLFKIKTIGMSYWSEFTPDASSPNRFNLPHGTYDLIAFNDDVTVSGGNLTVSRNKAQTARIGTSTVTVNDTPVYAQFSMKHVGTRLRTQIIAPKHIEEAITATLESTAPNVIPTSVAYNPITASYIPSNGIMSAETNNSPVSTEGKYAIYSGGKTPDYISIADYHYFLPNTQGAKLKLNFTGGKIYWKNLNGGTIPQLNSALVMSPAESYLVKITIKPKYRYLFSDGTTGFYKETLSGGGTKTPVGVVVKENNGTPNSGLAVALKDAGAPCYWTRYMGPITQGNTIQYNYHTQMTEINNDMKGEEYTYDKNYSDKGIAHASDPDFFSFQAAATYTPGVPLTGSLAGKKWYLPASGEWMLLASRLAFAEQKTFSAFGNSINNYPKLLNLAFTQVGGTEIWGGMEISNVKSYWTSTEVIDNGLFPFVLLLVSTGLMVNLLLAHPLVMIFSFVHS